eukprot:TRINITY_DN3995_c0_g1_i3.p1 TRINITY_DN3995_c0_g1~~TRINITY_DN3995_c0_g1_i3.p1  ORF type:complete len:125 (-),score=6.53 TRINITY_DN3995_c0_g1_i3:52-426(-)
MEIIPLFEAINFSTFLKKSKLNGWRVIGTSASDGNMESDQTSEKRTVHSLDSLDPATFHHPTILVLGNEGRGMRKNISELCDVLVHISPTNEKKLFTVDSLNVSAATSILLYKIASSMKSHFSQ